MQSGKPSINDGPQETMNQKSVLLPGPGGSTQYASRGHSRPQAGSKAGPRTSFIRLPG